VSEMTLTCEHNCQRNTCEKINN